MDSYRLYKNYLLYLVSPLRNTRRHQTIKKKYKNSPLSGQSENNYLELLSLYSNDKFNK